MLTTAHPPLSALQLSSIAKSSAEMGRGLNSHSRGGWKDMSLPSRRPFRHTQTKEPHSPEAEAATNEVIQADWCESPPLWMNPPTPASGCVTPSPSHMFFKVVPVSRGEAMLVHLRGLAQSALTLNLRWHSVSTLGGGAIAVRARSQTWHGKVWPHLLCNTIPANPLQVFSSALLPYYIKSIKTADLLISYQTWE